MKREKKKKCRETGKVRWPTERAALDELELIKLTGWCWRREQKHYYCHHCKGWHLSSQAPPRPARSVGGGKGKKGNGNGRDKGSIRRIVEPPIPAAVVATEAAATEAEREDS